MYQVLARKWRPQTLDELIGQQHVARTLRNAVGTARVAHAYLFAGVRGTGKTTVARILAKCLNCETGITPEPCGKCGACTEIDGGRFPDLIEIGRADPRRRVHPDADDRGLRACDTGRGLRVLDGSTWKPLTVPSGSQTGIKVNFAGPVNVTPGQTVLVVDFDVSRSFNFQGPRDRPTGVHFKPVLHASVADVAASIAGTVTPAS